VNRPVVLLTVLSACTGTVTLTGSVEVSPDDATGVGGVALSFRDEDDAEIATTRTAEDGAFELDLDRGLSVEVVIDDGTQRPVSFKGETGLEPTFEVPPGTLFLMPEAWIDAFREPFEGCPDAGVGDGLVLGQSALDIAVDDGVDRPPERCTFAFLESEDGERIEACYTAPVEDEEGVFAYDPAAERVGRLGRFLIPGVSGGPWRFVVGRYIDCERSGDGGTYIGETFVHVPEGGVIPRLPALVPL